MMPINRKVVYFGLFIGFILLFSFVFSQILLNNLTLYMDEKVDIFVINVQEDLIEKKNDAIQPEGAMETEIPGVLSRSDTIRIGNTGGDGLLIRSNPGIDASPLYWGADGETYVIVDGPEISGNSIWWQIKSVANDEKVGWANHEYLIRQ